MSNDDTNETPGARLTAARQKRRIPDVEARQMGDDARWYCHHTDNTIGMRLGRFIRRLLVERADLLADRAALMADLHDAQRLIGETAQAMTDMEDENARLRAQLDSAHRMIGECADELTRVEDQNLAMRPLVDAVADYAPESFAENYVACQFCDGEETFRPDDFRHGAGLRDGGDCPVTQARALVATWAEQPPAAPTPDGQEGGEG